MAAKKQYSIDVGQEILTLGLCNSIGALFQSCTLTLPPRARVHTLCSLCDSRLAAPDPVAGSLSRTAVNYESGSRTPLSSLLAALVIGLTLLLFTRLFYYAPMCVLASIVISAVFALIDYEEPLFLYRVRLPPLP
jgi:MFS superfamily sulfate permease-like transporter